MGWQHMKRYLPHHVTDRLKNCNCPVCGVSINTADFKDSLSIKEYRISGLCQSCQDSVFAPPEEY